ncbi:MAG: Rpn family recombination-promoting nuclease/putative transposase [Muricoprocola sp.]
MKRKKQLKELTIKDNFLFGAVMMEDENCRQFLEMALGFPIEHVDISKEKSIIYHPEYKGVRLDVYAKDENNTRYNIEMQVAKKPTLGNRVRYYHGQIDMELLLSGSDYAELPNVYVLFVCDFDPFGEKKYRYTFTRRCEKVSELSLQDGCTSIFLSTRGENAEEVPEKLVKFLAFVRADLEESETDFEDPFIKRLQETIHRIKKSREMEERYMIFEEMLRDERAEGRAEGRAEFILEVLNELGEISEELCDKILNEKNLDILTKWFKAALKSDSIEEFQSKM